jgi:acyl dehydratase
MRPPEPARGSCSLVWASEMRHLEDFRVGDVYDLGSTQIATPEIIGFARQFDPQVPHLDGSLASGWHVAAVFMRMYVAAVLRNTPAVSPGIDELRWLRPVRGEDTLTGRVIVLEIGPSPFQPDSGIVRQRGELRDSAGLPVLSMIFYGLFRRMQNIDSGSWRSHRKKFLPQLAWSTRPLTIRQSTHFRILNAFCSCRRIIC